MELQIMVRLIFITGVAATSTSYIVVLSNGSNKSRLFNFGAGTYITVSQTTAVV
jgi:hypothetical protein